MEEFNCPVLEAFGNTDANQIQVNLRFKLFGSYAFFRAAWILALAAVIIGVVEEVGLSHLLNLGLTSWAGFLPTVGELETAVCTPELVLFFCGDHAIASTATDESSEREDAMCSGAGIAFATEENLHSVVFYFCNHGRVFSAVHVTAPFGEFKAAIVERHCKDLINGAATQGIAPLLSHCSGAKSPFVVGHFNYLRRAVAFAQHEIPHAPDKGEAFRVFDEDICASGFHRRI
jgi:hypothetical protein